MTTPYRTSAAPVALPGTKTPEPTETRGHARLVRRALPAIMGATLVLAAPFVGAKLASTAPSPSPATSASSAPAPHEALSPTVVGVLLMPSTANLAPKSELTVVEVPAKLGARVKKGDVLLVYDARERRHALAAAKAAHKAQLATAGALGAEASAAAHRQTRRNATVEVDGRTIALVSGEEATQSAFDARGAGARAAAASAMAEEHKVRVAQLEQAVEDCRVVAPFDGVVTGLYADPSTVVHPGEVAVRVVGGTGLRIRLAVPEERRAELTAKGRVTFSVDGKELHATLDDIAPEVDAASRTYVAEGTVDTRAACGDTCVALAGRVVHVALGPR
ncbi:MAG: HlyD family efflux transporter periplasmic adaptor subunit [Polyangiaceae bacterium]